MKIKCTFTVGEWEVDYIVATNPRTKECRQFYSGYELIPDEPPKPSATDAELNRVTAWVTEISKQVNLQGSDIRRLTDRLDAIEGLGIQR